MNIKKLKLVIDKFLEIQLDKHYYFHVNLRVFFVWKFSFYFQFGTDGFLLDFTVCHLFEVAPIYLLALSGCIVLLS